MDGAPVEVEQMAALVNTALTLGWRGASPCEP
jgi:hypothetical protein